MQTPDWKKYAYTFIITAAIFATAIMASNFFNQKRINEIQNIESRIAVDILSSETQFSLLSELSCRDIGNSFLSRELSTLGERLSYTEEQRGSDNAEVLNLKRYYSLLQIKDYLLSQQIKQKCGNNSPAGELSIIYFYSNKDGECDDCGREGLVLTKLRQDYPDLRVYSFDYDLELSALQTLVALYNIKPDSYGGLPVLLIGDKIYYGFKSIDDIKNIIPELKAIDAERAELELQQDNATTSEAN